jgi:hypothetical protein
VFGDGHVNRGRHLISQEKVQLLIGEWCSSASVAVAQVANHEKVPPAGQYLDRRSDCWRRRAICVPELNAEPILASINLAARAYLLMRGSVVLKGAPKTLAASPQLKHAYLGMASGPLHSHPDLGH